MRVRSGIALFVTLGFAGACAGNDRALTTAAGSGGAPSAGPLDSGVGVGMGGGLLHLSPDASRGLPSGVPVPDVFVAGEFGGYAIGDAVTATTVVGAGSHQPDGGTGCNVLVGVVRDFRGINEPSGHPDFEAFDGKGATLGLVENLLGTDQKPVYASRCEATFAKAACPYGQMTTDAASFDQWYRTTEQVNLPFLVYLLFSPNQGVYTFASRAFFPLDDAGWGNSPHKSKHNFGFTTELHTAFTYGGGEEFTFTGDDDVWIFVNGKLAIDLGGLHPPRSETLSLDASSEALGITLGGTYSLDLFQAERHSASSNFRVDTTLAFTNCGTVVRERPR